MGDYEFSPEVLAQLRYCQVREIPMFLPQDGICWNCGARVFGGNGGYTVEDAGKRLLTSCPYCRKAWND